MGTDRKSRAKSLPWSKIIGTNACIVAVADAQGVTIYVNAAFTTITGWPPRDMLGRKLPLPHTARTALRRGRAWAGELRTRRKDGTFFWESVVLSPIPDAGFVKISRDITTSKQQRARRERLLVDFRRSALRDPLTGLLNRRGLETELADLARQPTGRRSLGVLVIDLDQLKQSNDRHGHATGDALLQELARRILAGVRPSDLVARIGGDEFVVVAAGAGPREIRAIAQRLLDKVHDRTFRIQSRMIRARVSIGAASIRGAVGQSLGNILAPADRALLQAKRRGRARACFARAQQCTT